MSHTDFEIAARASEARRLATLGAAPDEVVEELGRERPWLDDEQRAALWLIAWCVQEHARSCGPSRRRRARPGAMGGAWLEQATSRL
jgi:alkylhydroperoxidase family enzyme